MITTKLSNCPPQMSSVCVGNDMIRVRGGGGLDTVQGEEGGADSGEQLERSLRTSTEVISSLLKGINKLRTTCVYFILQFFRGNNVPLKGPVCSKNE